MTIAANPPGASDIRSGRLDGETLKDNFADLHRAVDPTRRGSRPSAAISATTRPASRPARPRSTFPLFIRQIAAGNRAGAAKTIFDANIMGGMCARVCPTETLCEEACVREAAEGKPVEIGRLQRYATDATDRDRANRLTARRTDRQAGGGRRRRARGARLRARLAIAGAMRSRSSRRARRPAASTNTASPPTRRSTISPRGRSISFSRSAASRSAAGRRSAATSRSRTCCATTTRCSWGWALARRQHAGLPRETSSGM